MLYPHPYPSESKKYEPSHEECISFIPIARPIEKEREHWRTKDVNKTSARASFVPFYLGFEFSLNRSFLRRTIGFWKMKFEMKEGGRSVEVFVMTQEPVKKTMLNAHELHMLFPSEEYVKPRRPAERGMGSSFQAWSFLKSPEIVVSYMDFTYTGPA